MVVRAPISLRIAGADAQRPVPPLVAGQHVTTWRDHDGVSCAVSYSRDRRHWIHFPGVATYCFDPSADEVLAFAEPSGSPSAIHDSFYRSVLPLALQVRGLEVLHAGAVRAAGGVVSLSAVSGTGKSTIAYGLSRRGYVQWADDVVAFQPAQTGALAVPLPFSVRLRSAPARYFGQLETWARLPSADGVPDRGESAVAPLRAAFVLERAAANTRTVGIERLSPGDAFVAVLPHACYFDLSDARRKQRMLRHYMSLAQHVPVFRVRFSDGLDRLPGIIDGIERVIDALPGGDDASARAGG